MEAFVFGDLGGKSPHRATGAETLHIVPAHEACFGAPLAREDQHLNEVTLDTAEFIAGRPHPAKLVKTESAFAGLHRPALDPRRWGSHDQLAVQAPAEEGRQGMKAELR